MPPAEASLASSPSSRWRGLLPYGGLAFTMLCWSGNWVVGRAIRDTIPPVAFNFWRWALALLVLAPFALPRLRGKGDVLRRRWPILLALGGTGVAAFQLLVYFGLRSTTVVNAVLMNSAAPLFIIVCAWLIERDRASPRQILGTLISFSGIVVIMMQGDISALRDLQFRGGDLVILAAMPAWGVYAVLLKRRPRELDGLALLFCIALAGLVVMAPLYLAEALLFQAATPGPGAAAAVLYVALFASVGAYICWNYGVAAVGPNRAGFMIHLLPAFATTLAILFLDETVHVYHFIGIAMILAGVFLATTARGR
jgi:drug/metabolite transporter (DMT)-like permease